MAASPRHTARFCAEKPSISTSVGSPGSVAYAVLRWRALTRRTDAKSVPSRSPDDTAASSRYASWRSRSEAGEAKPRPRPAWPRPRPLPPPFRRALSSPCARLPPDDGGGVAGVGLGGGGAASVIAARRQTHGENDESQLNSTQSGGHCPSLSQQRIQSTPAGDLLARRDRQKNCVIAV